MKQSDLKNYIKEEIISVLSETATDEDIENQKELNKELEKTKELVNEYENMSLSDIEEMGYEAGEILFSQIRDKFQHNQLFKAYFEGLKQGFLDNLGSYSLNEDEADKESSKEAKWSFIPPAIFIEFISEMVKKGIVDDNGKILDTPKYVKEFTKFKSKQKSLNEDIDDEDEADKAASKGAKKEPIGKISKKLGETQKEMKSVLVKFKKSEGAEKEKHLKRLKELTKIKKELEKSL